MAIPDGVYDVINNEGWVKVGIGHETALFAVRSIQRWWEESGVARFPKTGQLLITVDGTGSNSHRCRLWRVAVQ